MVPEPARVVSQTPLHGTRRRRRWEQDGYISADYGRSRSCDDGTVVGIVTWKPRGLPVGVTYEIAVGVAPGDRGQGLATAAQDLLVEYLLDHTIAHRIGALTNDANICEQKASSASASERKDSCATGSSSGQVRRRADPRPAPRRPAS
jgi:RimJ/RimL family protein N-acetyltransferase